MPENTLASFVRAAAEGVDEVELDLRLSRDRVPVVVHDETVDRTTDGHGAVAELTVTELQALDAGDGERIPTFDEVLHEVSVKILAEVKAPEVVESLVQLLTSRPSLRDRVDVISFDPAVVASMQRDVSRVRTGLLSSSGSRGLVEKAHDLGAAWVGVGWDGTTPELVEYAHSLGLQYGLWPVPTHDHIDRALRLGVDEVTTDYPRLIGERRGLSAGAGVTPRRGAG